LSSSTHKKVILRKMNREQVRGYVNPQTYLREDGVEILTLGGQAALLPYEDIKGVYFVREFEEQGDHLERKVFTSRPKLDGLWLRMKFKDDEVMDGILPNNLLLVAQTGFTITPPDPYANSQKIFVPKAALAELAVLGVIGSPIKRRRAAAAVPKEQISLFTE